jgi:hypothetical protein
MQKLATLREKYIPQAESVKLLLPLCPLNYTGLDYKLNLLQELKKRHTDNQ